MTDILHQRELAPHLPTKYFMKMVDFMRPSIKPGFSHDKSGYLVINNYRHQGIRGLSVNDWTGTIFIRPIQDEIAGYLLTSNPNVNTLGMAQKERTHVMIDTERVVDANVFRGFRVVFGKKHWLTQTFAHMVKYGIDPTRVSIALHYASKSDWSDEGVSSLQLLSDGRLASQPLSPVFIRQRVEFKVGFPGFKMMSWNNNDEKFQVLRIAP